MISAVDTNVLLDLLVPGAAGSGAARDLLDAADAEGALVIGEVVYAELSAQFAVRDNLDEFLKTTRIRLEPSSTDALHRSGEAWRKFSRSRRKNTIACPSCGKTQAIGCPSCGKPVPVRQHVLADFLIGGHALVHGDRLLSRDRGYYRTHFPELVVVAPAEKG